MMPRGSTSWQALEAVNIDPFRTLGLVRGISLERHLLCSHLQWASLL